MTEKAESPSEMAYLCYLALALGIYQVLMTGMTLDVFILSVEHV